MEQINLIRKGQRNGAEDSQALHLAEGRGKGFTGLRPFHQHYLKTGKAIKPLYTGLPIDRKKKKSGKA